MRIASGARMNAACAAAVLAIAISANALPTLAQNWPTRSVKIVVPYGAGGLADVHARLIADRLSTRLGQPFVIENRPGAGGTTAISGVLRSPADGYTLLFIAGLHYTILPLMQNLTYDPFKDLEPLSVSGRWGAVLGVHPDQPMKTLREFIDFARANPGKIDYSSAGLGGANHLAGAALAGREKLNMVHVPFGSGPASLTAVLSKNIFAHFGNSSDMIEPVKAGTIKALAVTTPKRMPQLPDVPTMGETIPGFDLSFWVGFVAAKGTPGNVIETAARTIADVSRDEAIVKRLYDLGIEATSIPPSGFIEMVNRERPFFENLAQTAGLRRQP